jgi:hypothetical protein
VTPTPPAVAGANNVADLSLALAAISLNDTPIRLYADVAQFLDGHAPRAPSPQVLRRDDGCALFYPGQVNSLFGDPESGKTWVAMAAVAETLASGGSAVVVDLDHNGLESTLSRLIALGVDEEVLRDAARFRYTEPEDADHLDRVVKDLCPWRPGVVVIDSIGELLPMLGCSSNSPDEFTAAHARALKPLAQVGSAVIIIDHLAKNNESRTQGASGTAAKRRAIGGTSLRVIPQEPFIPGHGGSCVLRVNKDRHGGLRAHCLPEKGEPLAGVFEIVDSDGELAWEMRPPTGHERLPQVTVSEADIAALNDLDPPPASQRDVKERLGWGSNRASDGLRAWRQARSGSAPEDQGA